MQKSFQFIILFFYNFTKIKIKSFECPKFIRNYEKNLWLEHQTLDWWVVCPIDPATQRIILKIVEFQLKSIFSPRLMLTASDPSKGKLSNPPSGVIQWDQTLLNSAWNSLIEYWITGGWWGIPHQCRLGPTIVQSCLQR